MRDFGFFNLKFITEVDQTNLQNSLESLQELQHEHEKSMQEAFNNTPEKRSLNQSSSTKPSVLVMAIEN